MFTTPATLHIRSPSPTTIEFTVSTLPPQTRPRRLLFILTALFRILLFSTLTLLLLTKYLFATTNPPPPWLLHPFLNPVAVFSACVAWRHLLPGAGVLLYLLLQRGYTSESLLVIRSLGVQISTIRHLWLPFGWGVEARFIPTGKVQDVVIVEGFCGFEVRFYLAVVVEGEGEVVVVFPRLLPGRRVLERVWRGARGCLREKEPTGV